MSDNKYAVRAICPKCKKESIFEFTDANEKQNFTYRKHTCKFCTFNGSEFLGWKIKY